MKSERRAAYDRYHQPEIKPIRINTRDPHVMPVMEIFGPTIQGEGMVIGQKTIFLRTGGCDYKCAWCDSSFTWNGSTEPDYLTAREVYERIVALSLNEAGQRICQHLTITGGNPALIGAPMAELISLLAADGFRFGIETQGTIYQDWFRHIDEFTLSPKPPSSMMRTNFPILDKIVDQLNEDGVAWSFKIVIFDEGDLAYAKALFKRYEGRLPDINYFSVGNENAQEEGDIAGRLLTKLEWLWNQVLTDPDFNHVRPLPQLHTLIYNNKKGV